MNNSQENNKSELKYLSIFVCAYTESRAQTFKPQKWTFYGTPQSVPMSQLKIVAVAKMRDLIIDQETENRLIVFTLTGRFLNLNPILSDGITKPLSR